MIEKIYLILKSYKLFILFTWFTRILLSIAFIPSGLKKVLGLRFTHIELDNPVGFFFEALYRAGIYWNFLGLIQLIAAILLLIPRTSFLGAVIYFPIVINILVMVISMNFSGTPIVVGFMSLANIYLFVWDYPKTKTLLGALFTQ